MSCSAQLEGAAMALMSPESLVPPILVILGTYTTSTRYAGGQLFLGVRQTGFEYSAV